MPVIPNFSGFAATPNLGSAFLGGARIAQDNQRIAQESAQAAQRIQLGREKIAADQVQNEMELQAKQKMLDQQMMQKQHEESINAAYRSTQLGLADRRLQSAETVTKMRLESAAKSFQQEQAYQRRYSELVPTLGEVEAQKQAMREVGFGSAGFSKSFEGANKPPPIDPEIKSSIRDLEGRMGREHGRLLASDDPQEREGLMRSIRGMEQEKAKLFQSTRQGLTIPKTITGTGQEVIRKTKDGRRAVFNSQTKEFIRYAE